MEIQFSSNRLARIFNAQRDLVRVYGKDTAKKIRLRMAVLRAARNLAEVPKKPPDRCHPLKGNRAGEYAVDLNHPFRLVFVPVVASQEASPVDEVGVITIRILKVEDYH